MKDLKTVLRERGVSGKHIAEQLGLSYFALAQKMAGNSAFKADEIAKIAAELRLTKDEVFEIFFDDECAWQAPENSEETT
jgi:cyanate lyase